MTQQQMNSDDGDRKPLQQDDFTTYGDYLKAWFAQYRQSKEIERISTKSLIEYEKGDLLDLIDELYKNNQIIWEEFGQTINQFADTTLTGQTLTLGEQQRRAARQQHQPSTMNDNNSSSWFRFFKS